MKEKLTELIKQAKYCTEEELADYLISAGLVLRREPMETTKKYLIDNIGCDDETIGYFEFTEEQYEFLNGVFTELNENSYYGCMPTIHINCKEQDDDLRKRMVLDRDEIDFDYNAEDV